MSPIFRGRLRAVQYNFAHANKSLSDGLSQVTFTHSGRAYKEHIIVFFNKNSSDFGASVDQTLVSHIELILQNQGTQWGRADYCEPPGLSNRAFGQDPKVSVLSGRVVGFVS